MGRRPQIIMKRALKNLLPGRISSNQDGGTMKMHGAFPAKMTTDVRLYEKEFESVQDVFELQRNLNNAFAYDLVPSPSVIIAALKAARRVNDFPTAVRIFEGIKAKVENKGQYDEYLRDLKPIRDELGVNLKEDLYPDPLYSGSVDAQAS
ncbi:Cytochrome c oxidase subunit 6 [Xylographa parallela]|nr:Cytochrome c oxidase subunit 6 [Xylographa parallela]